MDFHGTINRLPVGFPGLFPAAGAISSKIITATPCHQKGCGHGITSLNWANQQKKQQMLLVIFSDLSLKCRCIVVGLVSFLMTPDLIVMGTKGDCPNRSDPGNPWTKTSMSLRLAMKSRNTPPVTNHVSNFTNPHIEYD